MIKWDVASISSEFVLWMSDDHAQPGSTSLVGILSSSAFESMISKLVDKRLSKCVRLLVRLTSFLYSHESQASDPNCNPTSMWSLRSFAGTRVLQELESALGKPSLAAASHEKLAALFLVLFATIIAVGYSNPRRSSGGLDASTFGLPVCQAAQVFSEAQKHLICILAHHMVYIADRINLLEPNISRKRLIEGSACRWNRKATFQWKEMPAPKDVDVNTNLVSSCDIQDDSRSADRALPTGCPARCYHLSRSHTTKPSCRLAGGFGTCVHEPSLNHEPSPMDQILAGYQQTTTAPLDARPHNAHTSTPRSDSESTRHASNSTHRCSSDHLPSMSAKDPNYAAFECLAETDGMCAPFLCTDDDDDATNEASSMHCTTIPSTSPFSPFSAPQNSDRSFSTATGSPPSARSQDSTTTHDHNSSDQGSICRSCKFATLPFDTLDQDELCQFCSALPQHDGDISAPASNDPPGQEVLPQGMPEWVEHEREPANLLV